ncbi:hypothetical protein [Nocardioides stalactiti]|uniref:hypothetical protein n=1 Tax=Nocardioides stalactiti TaxID=2755356 RepID=UPI0016010E6A|nr:hypothetical protein [Nocardioides stalactiti]
MQTGTRRETRIDTGNGGLRPQRRLHVVGTAGEADVIQLGRQRSDVLPPSVVEVLARCLARWEDEEASGPHVVIALGEGARCFGPYPSRAQALVAAAAETAEWKREFPDADVCFEVAPLLESSEIAPADGAGLVAH